MEIIHFEKDIKAGYIKADSFPNGVLKAHQTLHSIVPFSMERQYYGISYNNEKGEIIYMAAAKELADSEMKSLGLNIFTIKKGDYISIILKDYQKDTSMIGKTFQDMLQHPQLDREGYCLEIYLNEKDLQCLVKIQL